MKNYISEKAYIAGKITGCENYKALFVAAAQELEKAGFIVLSPAILPEGMTPEDYIHICFGMIHQANVVVFLPNWEESGGARIEHAYCEYINKPIMYREAENAKQ